MKRMVFGALAVAVGAAGFMEAAPSAVAAPLETAPTSLDRLREAVRADALTRLQAGDVQTVRHKKGHRVKRYNSYRRWCSYKRYYGKRCYYTPWLLRPLRQR